MKLKISLILLVVVTMVSCFGGSAAGTVKDFYGKIEAGKLEAAMELLSNSTRSQVSADKMKQSLQQGTRQIDAKGGIKKIEVTEEKEIGETASVTVKITFGDGSEEINQSSLIKEDGKWRIQLSAGGK